MADTPAKPRRRWLTFSLRTLFVMVTAFACWLGWQVHVVAQRQAKIRSAQPNAAMFLFDVSPLPPAAAAHYGNRPGISFVRRWLGDAPVFVIAVYRKEDVGEFERLFPEAEVCWKPFGFH